MYPYQAALPVPASTSATQRECMNIPFTPHPDRLRPDGCVSLIGMAAAGKTTIGKELSALIGWGQLDADTIIESTYGAILQTIACGLDKEKFLDLEGDVISLINVKRCIISTGGSAVYREKAMLHLRTLGPIIYIAVPLPIILKRIARKPERGLAINPGQTVEDLFNERARLYERYADFTIGGGEEPASEYAGNIARWLGGEL